MDYLIYVTHDAENLQFYLWMVDYFRRFSNAPKTETSLSPKWNFDENPSSTVDPSKRISDKTAAFSKVEEVDRNDSNDISDASTLGDQQSNHRPSCPDCIDGLKRSSHIFQPFRSEINRIISHYINPGSPRELSLSHEDRAALLQALKHTTHPSAFSNVKIMLDMNLRYRAHPNFIRWSICNGNISWTILLHGFAFMNIALGFVIATMLTLSSFSRWFRVIAAAEWWFGFTNLIAASQGLCILLHNLHLRDIKPWEIDEHKHGRGHFPGDIEASFRGVNIEYSETKSRWPMKMEVFGPSNNYLKEAWIEKDRRKPMWRKILDRKVQVQDRGLRIMQNRIIWYAGAWALLITIPLTAVSVLFPNGNFF